MKINNWSMRLLIFFLVIIFGIIGVFSVKFYRIKSRDSIKKAISNSLIDNLNTYWENNKSFPDENYVGNLIKEKGFFDKIWYRLANGCGLARVFTSLENKKDKDCISNQICQKLGYRVDNGCCYILTISKHNVSDFSEETEMTKKARDSVTRNDAAEILNAYERYYATQRVYPWFNSEITQKDSVLLRSDTVGFGICGVNTNTKSPEIQSVNCIGESDNFGLLINADELRQGFANKDSFQPVIDGHPESALWLSYVGSEWSPRVCYIPRAKVNRSLNNNMFCLTDDGKTKRAGTVGCEVPVTTDPLWCQPEVAINSNLAIFNCIPE